jgi:hypothetical protein
VPVAIPLFEGIFPKNCSRASRPPADAPIPTTGNFAGDFAIVMLLVIKS